MRAAQSGSGSSSTVGPGARYVTVSALSSNDSAWNDLPDRTPPVTSTFMGLTIVARFTLMPGADAPIAAEISFRPLESDDLMLLAGWLGEPHVHRWWYQDPANVTADFGPAL